MAVPLLQGALEAVRLGTIPAGLLATGSSQNEFDSRRFRSFEREQRCEVETWRTRGTIRRSFISFFPQ